MVKKVFSIKHLPPHLALVFLNEGVTSDGGAA